MAKIIHVSNFGRRPKGAFQHCVENKISNGLIRNGHYVANFSDRDAARIGSWIGYRKQGTGAANKALREFCFNIKPDLLLLGHADIIKPETLITIRKELPSTRIVQWNVDPVFEPDNIRRISSKLDVVDATLISTAGEALAPIAKQTKNYVGFLPNPVDSSVETGRAHEKKDLPHDLLYVCGNPRIARFTCGKDWLPEQLIGRIEKDAPGIRLLLAGMKGFPHLAGAAYQQAMETSAIGLNLSRRSDYFLYSSDRLAQMCGNGLAILIDRATGYDKLFSDNEFAFFSTIEELTAKIRHLIADHDYRQALAKAGRERYYTLFNEQIIARYITDVAFNNLHEANYSWPTRYSTPK